MEKQQTAAQTKLNVLPSNIESLENNVIIPRGIKKGVCGIY